jgi:putative SOS response-associated peptidase YedK
MCFTIEVHLSRKSIEKRFGVNTFALYDFDFNYFYRAFSNPRIPVVAANDPGNAKLMQWGLIPSWTKDRFHADQIRKGTYNARSESLQEKPSFRQPLIRGRCLILAHGFFEWQHVGGKKIPWYIKLRDDQPFAFAGLFDTWRDPVEGEIHHTFSIITTLANPLLEKIHNTKRRMPVILTRESESQWISGENSPSNLISLLAPFDERKLMAYTISPSINDPKTDAGDPKVLSPHDYPAPESLFHLPE